MMGTVPPHYAGGNVDDWRIGKGATMYYPVSVPGALLSVGDPHAAQGDSELCGTAVESSWTGQFQVILHKAAKIAKTSPLAELDGPLLETSRGTTPSMARRRSSSSASISAGSAASPVASRVTISGRTTVSVWAWNAQITPSKIPFNKFPNTGQRPCGGRI